MPRLRSIHLVGSLDLPSATNVFEVIASLVGPAAKRIPDGETGERRNWVLWQVTTMARTPFLEAIDPAIELSGYTPPRRFALKPGTSASEFDF